MAANQNRKWVVSEMGKSPIIVPGFRGGRQIGVCLNHTHPFYQNLGTLEQHGKRWTGYHTKKERNPVSPVPGWGYNPGTTPELFPVFSLKVNGKCSKARGKNDFVCNPISEKTHTPAPIKGFSPEVWLNGSGVLVTVPDHRQNRTGGKYDFRF